MNQIAWSKRGLLYAPSGTRAWERSYALLPTPYLRKNGELRVYYASLDDQRFGSVGFATLGPDLSLQGTSDAPLISPGAIGTFDDSGVNPSSIVRVGEELWMYYVGWQRSERVPYVLLGGLAISRDDGDTFARYAPTPVFERRPDDPLIRSAPAVLHDGKTFRAWYVSARSWEDVNGTLYPVYEIRHAESANGIDWKADAETCIKHRDEFEFGFGRPWVVRDEGGYRMWYSVRSRREPYRIGYAESSDGYEWVRRDDRAGIHASSSGWDSEMICYAAVLRFRKQWVMLHNGNRHGSTGFGLAVGEEA